MTKYMSKIFNSKWFPRILCSKSDGGKDSGVTAYFLIEWKKFFSIVLLYFNNQSREAYHNHAFNAITWWIKGSVTEEQLRPNIHKNFRPSLKPKITKRSCCHKIIPHQPTWAISFRGPWKDTWNEYKNEELIILTHGRLRI